VNPFFLVAIPFGGVALALGGRTIQIKRLAILSLVVEIIGLWFATGRTITWLGLPLAVSPVEHFALALTIVGIAPVLLALADDWPGGEGMALGLTGLAIGVFAVESGQSAVTAGAASVLAGIVLTPVLVAENSVGAPTRAVRAFLAWAVLAGSALLVSGALNGRYAEQPTPGVLQPATAFLVVGLGILVAAMPFSLWLPALADAAPGGAAVVIGLFGMASTTVLAANFGSSTWLLTAFGIRAALAGGGGVAAILCTLLAIGEKRPGRLIALLLSANSDLALAWTVSSSVNSLAGVIWLLEFQFLAATLALAVLASCQGKVEGLFARRPLLALGLAIALWSLVGAPPTAGFTGRLMMAQSILTTNLPLLLEGFVCSVLGGLAILKLLAGLLRERDRVIEPTTFVDVAILIVALLVVFGGIYPNPIIAPLQAALAG